MAVDRDAEALADLARQLKLTSRQKRFAENLAEGDTQHDAAHKTGCPEGQASHVQGSKWAKMPKVQAYLSKLNALARTSGKLPPVEAARSAIADVREVQEGITAMARGLTDEQQRLAKLGIVVDLSQYVHTAMVPALDGGTVKTVVGVDVKGLQRDGLGHMIREVSDDDIKFYDPAPPNVALLRSRDEAYGKLARIHGIDKGSAAGATTVNVDKLLAVVPAGGLLEAFRGVLGGNGNGNGTH